MILKGNLYQKRIALKEYIHTMEQLDYKIMSMIIFLMGVIFYLEKMEVNGMQRKFRIHCRRENLG